jgi:signal transduction histidine kinase
MTAGSPGGEGIRDPLRRLWRDAYRRPTWTALCYAILSLPLAVLGMLYVLIAVLAGAVLSVTSLGLPWLAAGVVGARGIAALQRRLARALLGLPVGDPPPFRPAPGPFGWVRSGLADVAGWRATLYLVLRFPLALIGVEIVVLTWSYAVLFTTFPVYWKLISLGGPQMGDFTFDTWPRAFALSAAGVVLLLAAPWVQRAVLLPDRLLVRALLSATRGDRLRATRSLALDDSAAGLRRIERDLHDGAQARLAALAMRLGMAREELVEGDRSAALELIEAASQDARTALAELRDLAQGIRPPALDQGLSPALTALVARIPIPVRLAVELPERPSPGIETMVYFCIAELLANVTKHSGAAKAEVDVTARGATLWIRVTDDGAGGADPSGGGLSGLAVRLSLVDGRIDVDSPPGGPTVVALSLPSHP